VFLDSHIHCEYRVIDMPIMEEGTIIEFFISLKDPQTGESRNIEGPYKISRCKLVYRTDKPSVCGLSQYIELTRVP
jgi:hypothetical protein